jgi:Flp pilus assembly protein TadG
MIGTTLFASLRRDSGGTAAAEMALVAPLLTAILFGSVELGNYFMQEHVVAKAVRDGARYAARLPMTEYPACSPSTAAIAKIRNVTRTSSTAGGANGSRLKYWQDVMNGTQTITVAATCNTSGTYTGIYHDLAMGVPVVTVTAAVPYDSLFDVFGLFRRGAFKLNAKSQAAVMGS